MIATARTPEDRQKIAAYHRAKAEVKDGTDVSVKEPKIGDRVAIAVKLNGDKLVAAQVTFGQMFQHMGMHSR